MYFATIHFDSTVLLADIVAAQGQRAFIGKVNMNYNTPEGYGETTEESFQMTEKFIKQLKELQVRDFLLQNEQSLHHHHTAESRCS